MRIWFYSILLSLLVFLPQYARFGLLCHCFLCAWLARKKSPPPILTFVSIFLFVICGSKLSNYNYGMVMTTMLCYPFFYIGMIMKKLDLVNRMNKYISKRKAIKLPLMFILVVLLCHLGLENGHVDMVQCLTGKNLLVFYFISALISILIILICRNLLDVFSRLVETISNGTLLVLALHFPMISFFRKFYSFDTSLSRLFLGILIMILCYYGIILSKKYLQILLGKYYFLKKW